MRKRILKTALALTAVTGAVTGAYAYTNPEKVRKIVNTYNFFSAPRQSPTPEKLADPMPMKAIEIKQPINDESLVNSRSFYSFAKPKPVKRVESGQSEEQHVSTTMSSASNSDLASKESTLVLQTQKFNKMTKSDNHIDDISFKFDKLHDVDVKSSPITAVDVKKSSLNEEKIKTDDASNAQLKVDEAKILEALESVQKSIRCATEAKYRTIDAIQAHARALKQAVDEGTYGDWTSVNNALAAAERAAQNDIQLEAASRNDIDKLRNLIADTKLKSNGSALVLTAGETATKASHQLDELNYRTEKARLERRIFNQYRDLIDQSRRHFADELKSIVPGMDVTVQQGQLTKDELDALLSHAYLRVNQLRQQLIEQQVSEERNIANAIEEQQNADAKLAEAQLDLELRRVRENVNFDIEKKVFEERKVWETELEARLQRASAAHAQHLEDVIRTQKQLHDIENAKLVEEAVSHERLKHAHEVELSLAKLNGIEQALHGRLAMDMENRRAKHYWLICQNLLESIVYGRKAGDSTETRKKPLFDELKIIREACVNDDFVQSIVNLFPPTAVDGGVFTEQDLRNRFNKLYTIGRRTAKIDENGGGLMKYIMSFLQSLLMTEVPCVYSPQDFINVDPVDAFDVFARAKYFVEHGDFASAIRILQLLEGEPARLSRDWLADARAHLETRFLTQLLAAHATVTSIRSTY